MSELVPVGHQQQQFDEATKQRAFLVWMWECDSNLTQTARTLAAQEAGEAAFQERPPRKTPSVDTLRDWHRNDNWPAKRHLALMHDNTAGALYWDAIGKHLLLLDKAAAKHAQILDLPLSEPLINRDGEIIGEKPSTALPTIFKAIEGVYTIAKLIGRVEGDPQPQLPPRYLEERSSDEIVDVAAASRRQMARIADAKQKRRGKK